MKNQSILILFALTTSLIACHQNAANQNMPYGAASSSVRNVNAEAASDHSMSINHAAIAGGVIGGSIGESMDADDHSKMIKALDDIQRATWINEHTGYAYTVVPRQKVIISGFDDCRKYYILAMLNTGKEKVYGTACRNANGPWVGIANV